MNREVCVLRPAVAADVPFLVEIARRSWMSAFGDTAPSAFIERWKASDREPPWYAAYWPTMTVAECSGSVVGLVQPVGNEVNGLWVDPRTQGLGVGTSLLRSVDREIAAAGHGTVWVTTIADAKCL